MSNLHSLNQELADLEEKIKKHIEKGDIKEFLADQGQLINKHQEWRSEIINNTGRRFIEEIVNDIAHRAAN